MSEAHPGALWKPLFDIAKRVPSTGFKRLVLITRNLSRRSGCCRAHPHFVAAVCGSDRRTKKAE